MTGIGKPVKPADGIFSPPSEMKNKVATREPAFRQELITLAARYVAG